MKKNKKARLLSMDEIQARPCEVDGRPALFHRWIEEDKTLLRVDVFTNPEEQARLAARFSRDLICGPEYSPEVIRETFALVEYTDGTIAKVKPELIRFVDKEAQRRGI